MDQKENYTVGFLAGMSEVNEFEDAEPGSIQEKFWTRMKNNVFLIDFGMDLSSTVIFGFKILKQKGVFMSSMFITSVRKIMCKIKNAWEDKRPDLLPDLSRVYSWVSSDPERKRHSQGLIMRQGLTTPLITKGVRRTRRLFEADIIKISMAEGMSNAGLRLKSSEKTDDYSILKCMSDTVQYNSVEVERVNTENFRYLYLLCVLMFICAFIVLSLEIYVKNRPTTVTSLYDYFEIVYFRPVG